MRTIIAVVALLIPQVAGAGHGPCTKDSDCLPGYECVRKACKPKPTPKLREIRARGCAK